MSQTETGNRPNRRRKTLDISRIKVVVVVITGAIVGILSSLTGQGAQLAYTPALSWMLGFNLEKAHATAMRYALAAALAAVIIYAVKHYVVVGYLVQYGVPRRARPRPPLASAHNPACGERRHRSRRLRKHR